jgi:hypothetical protein
MKPLVHEREEEARMTTGTVTQTLTTYLKVNLWTPQQTKHDQFQSRCDHKPSTTNSNLNATAEPLKVNLWMPNSTSELPIRKSEVRQEKE